MAFGEPLPNALDFVQCFSFNTSFLLNQPRNERDRVIVVIPCILLGLMLPVHELIRDLRACEPRPSCLDLCSEYTSE